MNYFARLVLAAIVAVLSGASAVVAQSEIIEQVLVKVNGDIITKSELETKQISALRERANGQIDPELLRNEAQLKKAISEVTPLVLVSAIDEMLLLQMGREKGYKLSDDQFKSWLQKLREDQNMQDDAKFQAALRQEGMTIEELRKNVERQFIVSQVQREEVGSKLTITEEEARQYYAANKAEFAEPASVTLREIFIEFQSVMQQGKPAVSVAAEEAAMERAKAARARVTGGEDFAKVATEVSDASSKANGGLIGPLTVSQLSTGMQDLLQKMKPGDITEPLRTARGLQILKLETLKGSEVPAFEAVRDLAAERVHTARQESEFRKFMARIRSQAIIEWKNEELRKAYEKQVAGEATPPAR
jgi:peptidyl-prolyl cis-trans isomerase SurA